MSIHKNKKNQWNNSDFSRGMWIPPEYTDGYKVICKYCGNISYFPNTEPHTNNTWLIHCNECRHITPVSFPRTYSKASKATYTLINDTEDYLTEDTFWRKKEN